MHRKTVVVVILAVLLISGCTRSDRSAAPAALTAAPDFTLKDLAGKSVHLADLKGRVVLVDFWATWCPPCQASIPGIERLYTSYSGKGLVVLGLSVDEGPSEDLKSFASKIGITYQVLRADDDVAGKYGVRGIPAMFLVNKEGMVVKQYIGEGNDDALDRDIRSLL